MNCSLDLNRTIKLNKTLKINKNNQLIRTVSISKKTNKPKNYLSETVSSMNKKNVKFDNIKRTSKNSTKALLSYTTKCRQKSNISENIFYFDNLNHFSNNCDFGNDPFGHFD
jgi:hypothetical protein